MHIAQATYDNTLEILTHDFEKYVLSTGNAFFSLIFSVEISGNKLKNRKGLGLQGSVEGKK